ncbi:regenerating islet-derived protein 4-like isoform X3 [Crotalus tigris]|uniref:regenerating islet-derived protein 4-like isoform X3 n=1 Tax=Crotalus tigris TaxID=88082 RepID=UPI00192F25BB|nr:regenerating islet-derived protein 4-like isoform X3 [Crotalus tigris]
MRTILLVCIVLLLPIYLLHRCDAETEICPPGWMTSRGACYSIFCEKRTWAEAEKDCRNHGTRAHLASILDEKETTVVSNYIVSLLIKNLGPVWIGMFYKGKNINTGKKRTANKDSVTFASMSSSINGVDPSWRSSDHVGFRSIDQDRVGQLATANLLWTIQQFGSII